MKKQILISLILLSSVLTINAQSVLTDQTTPQTIGTDGARLAKLWTTDLNVANIITGSITGDAETLGGHSPNYFQTALTNPVTSPNSGINTYIPHYTGAGTIDTTGMYWDANLRKLTIIGPTNGQAGLSVSGAITSSYGMYPGWLSSGGSVNGTNFNSSMIGYQFSGIKKGFSTYYDMVTDHGTCQYNIFSFENIINQTGTATGAIRGLYINPAITSAYDFRAIELTNNVGKGIYQSGTAVNYLNGKLGIKTPTPTAYLHLGLAGTATAGTAPLKFTPVGAVLNTSPEIGAFEPAGDDISYTIVTGTARKQVVFTDGSNLTDNYIPVAHTNGRLINSAIYDNGNVGIGTTSTTGAKLTVKGKIVASEIQVKDSTTIIPDYVFKPGYELMSLSKVEDFVKQNQHLPEVPSEKEFKKEGMNVAEMNALLLKKVEELTLYAIKQNKQMIEQNKQISQLKEENKTIRELIAK